MDFLTNLIVVTIAQKLRNHLVTPADVSMWIGRILQYSQGGKELQITDTC